MRSAPRGQVSKALALRGIAAGLALLALASACRRQPPRAPHAVLVVVDTLRARNLGCYGYSRPTSPALDRFAGDAVLFENAISVGGNTTTAMAGMFTGQYAFFEYGVPWTWYGMERFGRRADGLGIPDSMTTLAERLSSADYRTVGLINNPYLKPSFAMHQGFGDYEQAFEPGDGPPARAGHVVERALERLRAVDWSRPTFVYLHFMDTHGPYPEPSAEFGGVALAASRPVEHQELWKAWDALEGAPAAAHEFELKYMTAAYDTAIRRVDEQVGRVVEFYRERGLIDQTVFVITADHGEEFLEHGGTGHRGTLFDEILHVPLLVRVPGGPRGARVATLVRSFDAAATIVDYAGLAPPPRMDARSLRPLLEGRPLGGAVTAYAGFPGIRMIRTDRYKLLRRQDGSEMFFDLRDDPGETRSLAASKDPVTERARLAHGRALDATADRLRRQGLAAAASSESAAAVDDATRAQLRALGYLE